MRGERTTPTGAALLKEFGDGFDEAVPLQVEAIGYGAGTRDDPDVPNLLRVMVGASAAPTSATELCELSCQLDTATGEQIGWLLDALLKRGATDAFATPITMKKGRPGVVLGALCRADDRPALEATLFERTTTLGVRWSPCERTECDREQVTVDVRGEVVRVKLRLRPASDLSSQTLFVGSMAKFVLDVVSTADGDDARAAGRALTFAVGSTVSWLVAGCHSGNFELAAGEARTFELSLLPVASGHLPLPEATVAYVNGDGTPKAPGQALLDAGPSRQLQSQAA